MNNKFDELAKGMAQSVTRRQALKKFGAGLAGMVLACFGLNSAHAASKKKTCLPYGSSCTPGVSQCCKGLSCFSNTIGQGPTCTPVANYRP